MRDIYVIAIQESTGGLINSSKAYFKYADAEAELKKDREHGISYTRIFTLHVKE